MQIQELQNKIRDDLAKLKHKQNLYEGVRSDRNLYSKQLVESQDEILSLKRTFRNMNHQIDQLKDEITAKDHAIVKEHFLHHSVDKERELLKNELTKIKKQLQSSDVIIENQRVEMLKLNKIVDEAEKERSRQRNELSSILAERNLLTSQVIKRNFELTTLYDRIKLQRSNLKIGERQFNKYNESISEWKRKLKDIVYSNNEAVGNIVGMQDLKNRIVQLERDILTEKSKTRALQDELEKPMNVHRWRTLESSDPKRFEKISQIQMLQKRLISKSDQVVQLDLLIQEKEKVYVELKHIIARQPGAEVEEQLLAYQQTLKEKNKHAKDMDEELDMYRQQVQTFKEDIEIIDANMAKLKKKWFKMQKENGTAPFNKSMNK
jgi:chromosome segregation ATPase